MCNSLNNIYNFKDISKKFIILGITDKIGEEMAIRINHIIIIFKHVIHTCRIQKRNPSFNFVITKFLEYENVEKIIAVKKGVVERHIEKWEKLRETFVQLSNRPQ